MKRLPDIVLFDGAVATGPAPAFELVHPADAIQWLATGRFPGETSLPMPWNHVPLHPWSEPETEQDRGKEAGAEGVILQAIGAGALRCAYVYDTTPEAESIEAASNSSRGRLVTLPDPSLPDLEPSKDFEYEPAFVNPSLGIAYADPVQFAGLPIRSDWDKYGFNLYFGSGEAEINLYNFWLFWSDLRSLRPGAKHPRLTAGAEPSVVPSSSSVRGRKRAWNYGAAYYRFAQQLEKIDPAKLAAMKVEHLAEDLAALVGVLNTERRHESQPDPRTVRNDASEIRNEVLRSLIG